MVRSLFVMSLVAFSSASLAQVSPVNRYCLVEYSHYLGINATIVQPFGTQISGSEFDDNVQTYDHTDSISGSGIDFSQVPPQPFDYSGTATTHADQRADVTLSGGGLHIVGSNNTLAMATGNHVINQARSWSYMAYDFNITQATTFSVSGADTDARAGFEFRVFRYDTNTDLFSSSFESNPMSYSAMGVIPVGRYSMRINSIVLANQSSAIQSQTFDFRVNPVPEPGSLAALGLGGMGLIRRRRSRSAVN